MDANQCIPKKSTLPTLGTPTITFQKCQGPHYDWDDIFISDDEGKEHVYQWSDGRIVYVRNDPYAVFNLVGRLRSYGTQFVENGDDSQLIVHASRKHSLIEIEMVYLGESSGICTLAVASVMYAVLHQAKRNNWSPIKGKVNIESLNGCGAFNCYNRAFELNGFVLYPKNEQLRVIKDTAIPGTNSSGKFEYTLNYFSKIQLAKEELTKKAKEELAKKSTDKTTGISSAIFGHKNNTEKTTTLRF